MDFRRQHGKKLDKNINVRIPRKYGSTNISHNNQGEE